MEGRYLRKCRRASRYRIWKAARNQNPFLLSWAARVLLSFYTFALFSSLCTWWERCASLSTFNQLACFPETSPKFLGERTWLAQLGSSVRPGLVNSDQNEQGNKGPPLRGRRVFREWMSWDGRIPQKVSRAWPYLSCLCPRTLQTIVHLGKRLFGTFWMPGTWICLLGSFLNLFEICLSL